MKQDVLKLVIEDVLGDSSGDDSEYISNRLRPGKDVITKGGHVVLQYRDQRLKLVYDNKRCIESGECMDLKGLADSRP